MTKISSTMAMLYLRKEKENGLIEEEDKSRLDAENGQTIINHYVEGAHKEVHLCKDALDVISLSTLRKIVQIITTRRIEVSIQKWQNVVELFLKEVGVKSLIATENTCDGKTRMLGSIIKFGLDSLLPITTKIKYCNEPPWMSQSLKEAIHRRQKALAQGNTCLFKTLRNRVNRERKSCRSKFYKSKVEHLKECSPSIW